MSWIVQNLLRDRVKIKTDSDITSDEYNDLIVLESKIKSLYSQGIISDKEMKIIEYVSDGKPLSQSKKHTGTNRISMSKHFRDLCNKIAFYIGGYFTDDGYLHYMKTKYKLDEKQLSELRNYMKNRFKYKIIRRIK